MFFDKISASKKAQISAHFNRLYRNQKFKPKLLMLICKVVADFKFGKTFNNNMRVREESM